MTGNQPAPADLMMDQTGRDLVEYSARLGADPLLIQGAGGNTSIKLGDILWVKASGTWLADAAKRDCFVPVMLHDFVNDLNGDNCESANAGTFIASGYSGGLRPSIETPLHALLPRKVVVHVHCVDTIAWAVCRDAETSLADRLHGLNWHFVPYQRPGWPLVAGIKEGIEREAEIFVLGNHGLIVSGEDVGGTARLLDAVRSRLEIEPTDIEVTESDRLSKLCEGTDYRPASDAGSSKLAYDPRFTELIAAGPLYPDHVVFLGTGPAIVSSEAEASALFSTKKAPDAVLIHGMGMTVKRDASAGTVAMLRCLGDVLLRVPEGCAIRHLNQSECNELQNWDAEKYRHAQIQGRV